MELNSKNIAESYQNVIKVKIALGLIENGGLLSSLENKPLNVENRILLCIIGYNQDMIKLFKDDILKEVDKIKQYMLGVYFFGKTGDLNIQSGNINNKKLFIV